MRGFLLRKTMITQLLIKDLHDFYELLSSEEKLIGLLEDLDEIHSTLGEDILRITNLNESKDIANASSTVRSTIINSTQESMKKCKFSQLALSIDRIRASEKLDYIGELVDIKTRAGSFIESLDSYAEKRNITSSINLITSAHNLRSGLTEIQTIYLTLTPSNPTSLHKPTLSIHLPGVIELDDFSNKISAFSEIIYICRNILGQKVPDSEIEIVKIESGSLFAEISGNPLIVALSTIVITKATDYIFGSLDTTKKIEPLRESSETLERILGIRKFLEEQNINTQEIDEEIKKAALQITKKINTLIANQEKIEINRISTRNTEKTLITGGRKN